MGIEIHGAISALTGVTQLIQTAIGARDHTKLAELSTKLTNQVMQAQAAALGIYGTLMDVTTQLADAKSKIAELEAALAEQQRHVLVEVGKGQFALLIHQAAQEHALAADRTDNAQRYACQRCFATTGKSIVLQYDDGGSHFPNKWVCPSCRTPILADRG